jgi:D-amino-acid dehydrogenase
MYDVVVVGGGVVGMSTAYHLSRAGVKTLLVDRADQGRATDAGAGIISPETNSRDADAWVEFAVDAAAYYSTLVQQLQTEQDADTGYARCGKLVVAVSDDEVDAFERARRRIFERQRRRGLPAPDDLYEVTPGEARRLFPPLGPARGAIYSRQAARVDGRLLNRALQRAGEHHGLTIHAGSVERLAVKDRAVREVVVNGATQSVDAVVIAGGAWSPTFAADLGVAIPVAPQRGQIIHLGLRGTDTSGWPMVNAFHDHYMVAWPDSRVVVGATRETGSGFAPLTTAAGVREILGEALRVAPGLAPAEIREIRVGLRPLCADGLPVLGPVPGVGNVFLVTGHGPTGLTLGPYSGKVVADVILGKAPSSDLSPFAVSRFARDSAAI